MQYKFHYYITNEDDEEILSGSALLSGFSDSFESVEEEIGKAQRRFQSYINAVQDDAELEEAESKGSEDGMDALQDK